MELSNSTVKTPEPETEAPIPTRIQLPPPGSANKHSPFTNGVLKRHAPPLHLHPPVVVTYRECLKNHAAALGGHAVDGCGEFMPSPASNPADPTSLRCAACGCHRNFHRRDPEETSPLLLPAPPQPALEYRPHHRHHPPPPGGASPDDSPSPPPISSAYYPPSAPHMLLALSHGMANPPPPPHDGGGSIFSPTPLSGGGRKRFRTKFTHTQKEKMMELAERVGWKMQRKDEELLNGVCGQIGVEKGVFKVWMHNNKNNFGKKGSGGVDLPSQFANAARINNNNNINPPPPPPNAAVPANGAAADYHHHRPPLEDEEDLEEDEEDHIDSKQNVHQQQQHHLHDHHHHHLINTARILGTNGSSSSS